MNQSALAEAIGLKQSAVSQYEVGGREPSGASLLAMAKLFNVSESYLRGDTDIREPYSITQEDFKSMYSEIYGLIREAKDSTDSFPESMDIFIQKLACATEEEVQMLIHFLDAIRSADK